MKNMIAIIALAALGGSGLAVAQNIYANNADGTPYIYVLNPANFVATQTLTNLSGSNGRGVVVVSGIIYYTSAGTNTVFSYTLATHTNNGVLFTVAAATALSTMAYDGTNFWIGDYSGKSPGVAYLYSNTGTLLKTITLPNCVANCDGLEYFLQGGVTPRLISNRGDPQAPYDIYDTNGNLVTAAFITPATLARSGIAFDGTNFEVSDIFNGKIEKYSGTTGTFMSSTAITGFTGGFPPLVEDLSADYSVTLAPSTTTPAPSTLVLMLCAMILLLLGGELLRRKRSRA